jgi:hypothetical protein
MLTLVILRCRRSRASKDVFSAIRRGSLRLILIVPTRCGAAEKDDEGARPHAINF